MQEGTFLFKATGPNAGTVFTNPDPQPGLIDPVVEYDHTDAAGEEIRVAIIGGYVYRGSLIPDLVGKYVCADLKGFVFVADLVTGEISQLLHLGTFIKGIGEDADKELYLTTSTTEGTGRPGARNGSVLKILAAPAGD